MVLTATNQQVVAWDHEDTRFLKITRGVCKGNKPLFLESLLRGKGDVQLYILSKLLLGHSYITIYTNWAYTSQLSKKQNKKQY